MRSTRKPSRRSMLAATFGGIAAAAAALPAQAQEGYPSRPIRIVIPTPAGGGLDGTVRAVAEKLQAAWKQPVVVESRAGGNGAIAYNAVANAAPDGYTVLVSLSSLVQTPLLSKTPTFKIDDLAPVSLVALLPNGFAVGKGVPADNLEQFVRWARQQPQGVTYGSSGAGSSGNIMGGTLAQLAGLNMLHVPFKGEVPVIQAMLGGEIQGAMAAPGSLAAHAKSGAIKLLAVALPNRLRDYPDVPTFGELGYPAVNLSGWSMALVPKGTPQPLVDKLAAEISRIVRLPDVAARIHGYGFQPEGGTPDAARAFVADETRRWGAAIKAANIQID
ncbi:MAG: tripartite tricarboxylate transporter substrate binding protein [Rubrivivax sp.]